MKEKKNRRLKVYGQNNGYNYQDVPTIVLKGKCLKATGVDIGAILLEECADGKITIKAVDRSGAIMDS